MRAPPTPTSTPCSHSQQVVRGPREKTGVCGGTPLPPSPPPPPAAATIKPLEDQERRQGCVWAGRGPVGHQDWRGHHVHRQHLGAPHGAHVPAHGVRHLQVEAGHVVHAVLQLPQAQPHVGVLQVKVGHVAGHVDHLSRYLRAGHVGCTGAVGRVVVGWVLLQGGRPAGM